MNKKNIEHILGVIYNNPEWDVENIVSYLNGILNEIEINNQKIRLKGVKNGKNKWNFV